MLKPGVTLGPFAISSKLGEGGMGEVWRATDSKLGREIALKLLPENFAADTERHARFEREAKTLASLNHPGIATLFGLEHIDGHHVLVMELVEGEGLDELIARGPVPPGDVIAIALQIADALEAAHEKGIVHRDLKPANVRIRPDGTVKVLDFGLAKAWDDGGSDTTISQSPTITRHHTQAGVILGTAAYMAPEQARGRSVDRRADIWAFGVVLYEMLTGRRLFEGETVTDVLANVLKQDVDWNLLPAATPGGLGHVLRRCLERKPDDRIRDIGDVRWELAHIADRDGEGPGATAGASRRHATLPWLAGIGIGVVLAAVLAGTVLRPHPQTPRTVQSSIAPPSGAEFNFDAAIGGPVVSPDGTKLVFPARDANGHSSLWIRNLDALGAQPLPGTESGTFPFWSPDSRWVAFFVGGKLRKIDVTGGPPVIICDAVSGRGGTWNAAGVIVFAPNVFGGLQSVAAAGGIPTALSQVDSSRHETSQRWPVFLPDGQHYVYWAGSPLNSRNVETDGIYLASLDDPRASFLIPADSNALFAAPGYLLYLRARVMMARPFDADRRVFTGEAIPIAENVANPQNYRLGDFSVSQEGTLVYQTGATGVNQCAWVDSTGRTLSTLGEPAAINGIRLSPDGNLLAEQVADIRSGNIDIWIVDIARDVRTRFTFDPGVEIDPIWSPDSRSIVYSANPQGNLDLYVKNANGSGEVRTIDDSPVQMYASDWSPDGHYLAVTAVDPQATTVGDIWILSPDADQSPTPLLATPFYETGAVFSPDGKWLAYQSSESGRDEIYVTPFPGPGGKWQVSQGGGSDPLWRHDGAAIFYRAPDGAMMTAGIAFSRDAAEVATPRELFKAAPVSGTNASHTFAVSPRGNTFLMLQPTSTGVVPLTLVLNWAAALRR